MIFLNVLLQANVHSSLHLLLSRIRHISNISLHAPEQLHRLAAHVPCSADLPSYIWYRNDTLPVLLDNGGTDPSITGSGSPFFSLQGAEYMTVVLVYMNAADFGTILL